MLVFGHGVDHEIRQLLYQLLHGLAGTILEAKKRQIPLAAFVVHEILPPDTTKEKPAVTQNARDFERFLRALFHHERIEFRSGILYGPLKRSGVEIYIGQASNLDHEH